MNIYRFPDQSLWKTLCRRPSLDQDALIRQVRAILEEVKLNGDAALKKLSLQFDGYAPESFRVTPEEFQQSRHELSEELIEAIGIARNNIEAFHRVQKSDPPKVTTMAGISCWQKSLGIEKVGLYVPGGTAPLFSTILMLGIPAQIAGCKEIILCSPPSVDGKLPAVVLYTASLLGIDQVYKVGGAQAIAAMSYGTTSVPAVHKIFGPGNQYVTAAKQLVQQNGVAIDMPAGPSEVAIFADDTANAAFVAADLLSQAEHGPDSQVLLVTTHEPLIAQVQKELDAQLNMLPRAAVASRALDNSKIILVETADQAMGFLNEYAPEHLILSVAEADQRADEVMHAGSVFLGHYSPESAGDYASGTNHTLPTNGFAKAYSGVSVDSFCKKITYQQLSVEGLMNIGPAIEIMASAEGLEAHKQAVSIRMAAIGREKEL